MADFVERMRALRIGERYTLFRPLGEGSFGKVYLGRDVETDKEVAIKLEHCKVDPSLLDEEVAIYKLLQSEPGFPTVFWHGSQATFQVMVFELLGPNLEDLLQYCGGKFSLKTTLMLFDQLLRRFESLHVASYLHRDVKPENFLMGTGENGNTVYMIDLGLLIYKYDGEYLKTRKTTYVSATPGLVGTCRYASINGHLGIGQSRKDDLEALGYMMVYFMKGSLPWQGLKATSRRSKYRQVLEMKQSTTAEDLCRGLPSTFVTYFHNIRALTAVDVPDYNHLRHIFRQLFRQQNFEYDNVFDWTLIEFYRQHPEYLANTRPTTSSRK